MNQEDLNQEDSGVDEELQRQIARGDFIDDEAKDDAPEEEPASESDEPAGEDPSASEINEGDEEEEELEPAASDEDGDDDEDKGAKDERPRDEKGRFAIPKERFDQAVGKEREAREAAERRVAELEQQLTSRAKEAEQGEEIDALETQISEMESRHADLLIDGDKEGAAKVMREIRLTERQIARIESRADAQSTTSQILEAERFELAVAKIEAEHPLLNPASEEYDEELVELILAKQAALVQRGAPASRAIIEAAEGIMKRFGPKEEPAKKEEDSRGLAAAKKGEDRKKDQIAKNVKAKESQAPSLKDVGVDSDKLGSKALPKVSDMTPEEYAALPEATRARLRGDLVS